MEKLGYFDSIRVLPILNMSTEFYLFSEKTRCVFAKPFLIAGVRSESPYKVENLCRLEWFIGLEVRISRLHRVASIVRV